MPATTRVKQVHERHQRIAERLGQPGWPSLATRLSAFLRRFQARAERNVLAGLQKAAGLPDDWLSEAFWAAFLAGLTKLLITAGRQAFYNAALTEAKRLGVQVDRAALEREADAYLAQQAALQAQGITMTQRRLTGQAFDEWSDAGADPDQLSTQLKPAFGLSRAVLIATTFGVAVGVMADKHIWRQQQIDYAVWKAVMDEATCEECAGLDGDKVPLSGGFAPPLHPQCRCTLIPASAAAED